MAQIQFSRTLPLSGKEIVQRLNDKTQSFAQKHQLEWDWQGNHLHIRGSGLKGVFEVIQNRVHVDLRLGLLLSAFSEKIERELHDFFDSLIPNQPAT